MNKRPVVGNPPQGSGKEYVDWSKMVGFTPTTSITFKPNNPAELPNFLKKNENKRSLL